MSIYLKKLPKQDRSRATFEAIVEAATRIIESDGLAGLSTNRTAAVAGVSIGSLYQYFPNKQALVEEVRARFASRFQTSMLELLGRLPGLDLRRAIRAWVETLVALHAESPGVHNAVGTGTPPADRSSLETVVEAYLDAHAAEIRRPDRQRAGRLMLETAEAIIHGTALREPERLDDTLWVDEICDLLERYLVRDDR